MIIKIHDSIIDNLTNCDLDRYKKRIDILNELGRAHWKNKHIITGTVGVFEYLKSISDIDKTAKEVFTILSEKTIFMLGYLDCVETYMLITVEKSLCTLEDDKKVFIENIDDLYRVDFDRTSLIIENLDDGKLYLNIAKTYILNKLQESNIYVNVDLRAGGGSTSYEVFKNCIENKKITLAITDSDKKYELCPCGETYRKVESEYLKVKDDSISSIYHLPVRMKENLIPPSLYLRYLRINGSNSELLLEKLNKLERIQNSDNSEKLKYLNLKNGVSKKKILETNQKKEYYSEIFDEIFEDIIDDETIVCKIGDALVKDINNKVLNNEYIIRELAKKENVLGQISNVDKDSLIEDIEYFKDISKDYKDIYSHLPDDWRCYWEEIGKKILTWGCCISQSRGTMIS